jgi:hypothetical protein
MAHLATVFYFFSRKKKVLINNLKKNTCKLLLHCYMHTLKSLIKQSNYIYIELIIYLFLDE